MKVNNEIIDVLNQTLHNEGIEFDKRLKIVVDLINYKFNKTTKPKQNLIDIIESVSINKSELFQKVFMFYGNKITKIKLDQYYTPITIGEFITNLCDKGKSLIDPACGSGDLAINYQGNITLWDISPEIIEICKFNYELQEKKYTIECTNSLINDVSNTFDYCVLNPPFGTSTVITDPAVLNQYELGKNKKKEEIGILFIEKGIRLLKDNGIIFIILPNGYLGNNTKNTKQLREYLQEYQILAIIELPNHTFIRSGTGVSTSLLILKKTKPTHKFIVHQIQNIGYVLNKKNTPYKYKMNGSELLLVDNKPVLDNDFDTCFKTVHDFINNKKTTLTTIGKSNILDVKRYLPNYTSIIEKAKHTYNKVSDYVVNETGKFKIIKEKEYLYLDIKQVNTPNYNSTNILYGYELPGRAKIILKKNDIIVSKLKGKIVFTILLEDDIICSNGFCLLRPKDYESAVILFANLFSNDFKQQHVSLCTGSIMESITEKDIKNIYVNSEIDYGKYNNIIKALEVINSELK